MLWPGHAQKGPRCAQECSAAETPWVHWGQKGPSQSMGGVGGFQQGRQQRLLI